MLDIALIVTSVVVGVVGHVAALWILQKSSRQRNPKHVFLLRCLAANDLVSQLGMVTLLVAMKRARKLWTCVGFVVVRAFGLGSGCVAFVMAVERYLSLTKPFFYHRFITFRVLQVATAVIWSFGLLLTYLPLVGFGIYYKVNKTDNFSITCAKYKEATEWEDVTYAYIYFVVGVSFCSCITYCNMRVIAAVSRTRSQRKVLIRRVSRSTMNNRVEHCQQNATSEEVAFAKVMAILCVIFVVCWLPQVITIPFTQLLSSNGGRIVKKLNKIADNLMMLYFAVDPYVYVIHKYYQKFRTAVRTNSNPVHSSSSVGAGTPTTAPTTILLQYPQKA